VLDARALNTGDVNGWVAEVPLRVRARQFNEAHAAADQALKIAPDNAEALYQKASIYHASGQVSAGPGRLRARPQGPAQACRIPVGPRRPADRSEPRR
jgi:tetratricopeptide (TPR) repeat protein